MISVSRRSVSSFPNLLCLRSPLVLPLYQLLQSFVWLWLMGTWLMMGTQHNAISLLTPLESWGMRGGREGKEMGTDREIWGEAKEEKWPRRVRSVDVYCGSAVRVITAKAVNNNDSSVFRWKIQLRLWQSGSLDDLKHFKLKQNQTLMEFVEKITTITASIRLRITFFSPGQNVLQISSSWRPSNTLEICKLTF